MNQTGRRGIAQFLRPMNYLRSSVGYFFKSQKSRFLKNKLNFNWLRINCSLAFNLLYNITENRGKNLTARFSKGFTLVEALTVLVIAGVLTGIAAPGINSWLDSFELKSAVREIGITMQLARMKAIARGVEYRVVFDLDAETFHTERGNQADGSDTWVVEGALIEVSSRVDIAFVNSYAAGKRDKQFNPNGTSSTGSIRLKSAQGKKYIITLTTATGHINVAEGW